MKMKPFVTAALLAGLTCLSAHAQQAFPLGQWKDPAGDVTIRIEPCTAQSATLCGVIVADLRADGEANPPGYRVLDSLKLKRGVWRGKFADGGISGGVTLKPRAAGEAAVRFCFAAIACETEIWQRAEPAATAPGSRR